jgi:hypothetical protein
MGLSPMGSMGFGKSSLASLMRVPMPPQRMTAFMNRGLRNVLNARGEDSIREPVSQAKDGYGAHLVPLVFEDCRAYRARFAA